MHLMLLRSLQHLWHCPRYHHLQVLMRCSSSTLAFRMPCTCVTSASSGCRWVKLQTTRSAVYCEKCSAGEMWCYYLLYRWKAHSMSFRSGCGAMVIAAQMTKHKMTCVSKSIDDSHDGNAGVVSDTREVQQSIENNESASPSSTIACPASAVSPYASSASSSSVSSDPFVASSSPSAAAALPHQSSACDYFFASWKYPNTEYTVWWYVMRTCDEKLWWWVNCDDVVKLWGVKWILCHEVYCIYNSD